MIATMAENRLSSTQFPPSAVFGVAREQYERNLQMDHAIFIFGIERGFQKKRV
jgi:hypothetical protein